MSANASAGRPTLLVSRHPGAQKWLVAEAQARDWAPVQVVEHLDTDGWQYADRVAGTLPLPLIAILCAAGVPVWQLDLSLDRACRGQDLSAQQMVARGARLRQIRVEFPEERS